MIKTSDIFTWIPRDYTPTSGVKVTHSGTENDVSNSVSNGSFIRKATNGIGDFTVKIANPDGTYDDSFSEGDTVSFYADYTTGGTKQFAGRVDFVKKILDLNGKFIELEGRHISYPVLEKYVNKTYSAKTIDYILKDIADDFLPGFTYSNTEAFTNTFDIAFSNITAWECFMQLCSLDGADCYIDNDLDIHLFPVNSIFRDDDAIVEGNTLRELKDFGEDSVEKRNKVIVYGEDDNGLPIIYTAGTGSREYVIRDSAINTDVIAKDIGDSKLLELNVNANRGLCVCFGMPFVQPAENIWISAPRSNIHGIYKVLEIRHTLEKKFWATNCLVEIPLKNTGNLIAERIRAERALRKSPNENNMDFSYSFNFDDNSNLDTETNTEVVGGKLKLTAGSSSGTTITSNKPSDSIITDVELRYDGKDLGNTVFSASANGGINYMTITRNTKYTFSATGKLLKLKIVFGTDALNVNPEIDSLSLLFKTS